VIPEPLQVVEVVETVQNDPVEVPVPEVEAPPPQIEVPMPEFEIPLEAEPPPIVAAPPDAAPVTAPAPLIQDEELKADRALTPPIYPSVSRKLNEQGTVTLMIYVLPDGRVGDVRVDKSSGFPRLDEAAVQAARKGWRFRPAKQGGAAVASWGRYAVKFQLTGA
jgi:periplasmic protein TonB